MRTLLFFPALALLASAILFSCKPNVVRGGGPQGSDDRSVSSFTAVTLEVPLSAEITVSPSSTASVQLSGSQNIISKIKTEVKDGTLRIFLPEGVYISDGGETKATISMPALRGLDISGSSNALVKGLVSGDKLDIEVSGSGDIKMENVRVQELDADLSGSGNLEISAGTAGKASYDISGSGSVRCFGVVSQDVEAGVSGAGSMQVNAASNLDVDISGAGNVDYKGNPRITQDVSGAGSISPAN